MTTALLTDVFELVKLVFVLQAYVAYADILTDHAVKPLNNAFRFKPNQNVAFMLFLMKH